MQKVKEIDDAQLTHGIAKSTTKTSGKTNKIYGSKLILMWCDIFSILYVICVCDLILH